MQAPENTTISFGEFELDPLRRLLLKHDKPVALKPKAFDLLLTFVQYHGEVLSKNDLMDKVWENQFVEENNLTVHIAALRKAFGEKKSENRFIVTVPGVGYKFVADFKPPQTTEVVVESHSFEQYSIEEEIEVGIDEDRSLNRNLVPQAITPPVRQRTFAGWLKEHRLAVGLLIAATALFGIGGNYALRGRMATSFSAAAPFVQHSIRQLTTNGKVGNAALSPDGKLFAYTIDDIGQKSLWLGYVAGGNHLPLIPAAEASYRNIVFSPDGKDIYFSLRDDKNPKFALYKMPVFGGVQTKVMDEIGNFSLSPDGRQIAIARYDAEKKADVIVVAALEGSEQRDVAWFPKENSYASGTLSWSADGNRLALGSAKDGKLATHEIAIVNISTGKVERVAAAGVREITKTAWLADGSGLIITGLETWAQSSVAQYQLWHLSLPGGDVSLITTDRSNYGASWHNDAGATLSLAASSEMLLAIEHRQLSNVWVAPSDDLTAARQITFSSFGKYDGLWGIDWTPDGRLIYTTSDTRSQFLAQMNADGSDQKPLTQAGKIDSQPVISNDGRYILFHSNRTSEMDIWRSDIDGGNPKQLTFGGKAFHPAPSPDGRWLYYKSWLKELGELCRVPIDGGEPECLNDKETSWGSFSPNGKYFAASYMTDKQRLAIFSAETNQIVNQFELPKTGTLYMGSHWTPDSEAVVYRDRNVGYWIHPIDGGGPRQMEGLPKEKLYNFAFSRDGRQFAFVRGQEIRDVVILQNAAE